MKEIKKFIAMYAFRKKGMEFIMKEKRIIKNIAISVIIIFLGLSVFFTMKLAKTELINNNVNEKMEMPEPPDGEMKNNKDSAEGERPTPPDMSNKSDENTVGDNKEVNSKENQTRDENNLNENRPEPPDMNQNSNSSNKENGDFKPDNMKPNEMKPNEINSNEIKLSTKFYILFILESVIISVLILYMIMSKFNKDMFKQVFCNIKKVIVFVIFVVILSVGISISTIEITKNVFLKVDEINSPELNMPGGNMMNPNQNCDSVEATATTIVNGNEQSLTEKYISTNSDESAILVENGGNATISNAVIDKSSGNSTNTENSEFYGVNAGILVKSNSTATIKNATISTNAKGSNAVFSTGTDSKIYISDSTITTEGESSSRGLDATYGGYIEADNVKISTKGGSCAALATDRGEGTIIAKNSNFETNGAGSPVIYSTGNISITDSIGTANGAQTVVIEGKNSATVTSSKLYATGTGNRGDVDIAGVMIYQSMSGDASVGTGNFTAKDSTLELVSSSKYYKTAPMFFITNTDAIINLENTKLNFGSNILISAKGTDQWGKSESNGGNVTLNAVNQVMEGNIELDNISTLKMNLSDNSSYEGTINSENTAKNISLKIDSSSKIKLTGDSYVTSLEDEDANYNNIDFNGFKLYVNGVAIN